MRCTFRGVAQAEARRYLEALERAAAARGSAVFGVSELYTLADRINLQVEVHDLIEALNEAGASCRCVGPNASVVALALLHTP